MILFKRVSESFSSIEGREWALLALETFGVVAGILIAFALNEWATKQADSARQHQLMERLVEESEMDVAVLREMRDSLDGLVAEEKAFALALGSERCPPERQWGAVETISMLPALTAPASVYQELMGAGGLSSIQRRDVRKAVALFHDDLDWSQQQIAYFRQVKEDPVPTRDPRVTISYDPTNEEPEVATFNRGALCGDHGFRNTYAAALRQHIVFTSYHQRATADAINMCVHLGDSLGKRCEPAFGGPLKGADADYAAKEVTKMRAELAENLRQSPRAPSL